jgi:hypothetical protein
LKRFEKKLIKFSVRQRADDPGIESANKASAVATLPRKELARVWHFWQSYSPFKVAIDPDYY